MNKQVLNQKMHNTKTLHKTGTVDELSIFYRETGDSANPKLILLHGDKWRNGWIDNPSFGVVVR
jgi:hypothetical protein